MFTNTRNIILGQTYTNSEKERKKEHMKNDVSVEIHWRIKIQQKLHLKKIQRKSFCARLLCSCNGRNSTVKKTQNDKIINLHAP